MKTVGAREMATIQNHHWQQIFPVMTLAVALLAILLSYLEYSLFSRWQKLPFIAFLLAKYLTIIVTIASVCFLLTLISKLFFNASSLVQAVGTAGVLITSEAVLSLVAFLIVYSMLLNVFQALTNYLGPQALIGVLLGRYHQPSEQDLAFIFLDLESSTSIAEMMGSKQYSLFVSRCFELLTMCIYECNASIYQFVGDEAVLFWDEKEAADSLFPMKLYFNFKKALADDSTYFNFNFGLRPTFRAAVHAGTVTITEIKSIKTEIVYHGDVLNTCARIKDFASRSQSDLVVSEHVSSWVEKSDRFDAKLIANEQLRGKQSNLKLYAIQDRL